MTSRAFAGRCLVALASAMFANGVWAQDAADHPSADTPRQVASGGDEPVYPATFFAPFQPQTALDMVQRTPGFVLSEGSFVRGFGGAAGNALIDGQRPTVKIGGVAEVLRRIPATRVERIVLLRGGDTAETLGQMLVANVVLKADGGGSGTATVGAVRTADGRLSPSARLSYAKAMGSWQTSLELSGERQRYPSRARYHVFDAAGALEQSRAEHTFAIAPELGLAASASRPLGGGTLTLNLRLGYDLYRSRDDVDVFTSDLGPVPSGDRTVAYRERGRFGELGVDWTRPLGNDWAAKLVGLGRLQWDRVEGDFVETDLGGAFYRGLSDLRQKPSEMVVRATFGREGEHALRPEFGGEIAWNALTSLLDYREDLGSGLVPVALSGADTRVTELRGEAFANLRARLKGGLGLEAGLAFEFSRIRVRGEASNSQSLTYLKPSLALTWSPGSNTEMRLGVRRTVDQLDFGDFAASVDQADGRDFGGNAGLRPARITRFFLRVDHRWGQGGAISTEFFHQGHVGPLGYIILPSGDQALGTIGNASQAGATAQATVPLGAIMPGAQLKLDATLLRSRIRDGLTGQKRSMDDLRNAMLTAEFRHDVPSLKSSWGLRYVAPSSERFYYTGERATYRDKAIWTVYVETTALRGFKAVLTVEGVTGQDGDRDRDFYAPTRAGSFTGREVKLFRQGAKASLMLTRSF